MDWFEECHAINDLLLRKDEQEARARIIVLLDDFAAKKQDIPPLVNALLRQVGLFPYISDETANWQERFVREAFKVDTGGGVEVTLHREQSRLLKALLDGKSIAVSAPTSFGKSFVIDSFIALRKPSTVVILVPTVALTDETRRRLQRKFGRQYKIITAPDQSLGENSILVFPQERSISYAKKLESIDMLVVDEFYKASLEFDRERAPSLIRAIIDLGRIAKQKYFLAPNIDEIRDNPFTEGMEILYLPFSTVVLQQTDLSSETDGNEDAKSIALLRILANEPGKTLIYAGTYANVRRIGTLLMSSMKVRSRDLLIQFQSWLSKNYDPNWPLTKLVSRGVGIHYGRLHRSLGQIQVKLFEEENGLDSIISTSSIIEGVNTSAETVVLWSNRNGKAKINDFTYKNIIGRGGRMFRHFIGNIFILEQPPGGVKTQLQLDFPDDLLGPLDATNVDISFSPEQAAAIEKYKEELIDIVGSDNFEYFQAEQAFQSSSANAILRIAKEIAGNRNSWNGISNLNSASSDRWDYFLYKLIRLQPSGWGSEYGKFAQFVKVIASNWERTIPELLKTLDTMDIGLDEFFELERNVSFKLATILTDVQTIYRRVHSNVDLQPAITRFTNAFLPPLVHQLEEFGLPRMISRKIHSSGALDLVSDGREMSTIIDEFRSVGMSKLFQLCEGLDPFDRYIIMYFYEGIT